MENDFILKNTYNNPDERISFRVEIAKCALEEKCKDEVMIKNLLSKIMFKMYYLDEVANLTDPDSYRKRPIGAFDQLHSQFLIDLNSYRDNDNFMIFNSVKTDDERFLLHEEPVDYYYFSLV